jgi:hypothetical protein
MPAMKTASDSDDKEHSIADAELLERAGADDAAARPIDQALSSERDGVVAVSEPGPAAGTGGTSLPRHGGEDNRPAEMPAAKSASGEDIAVFTTEVQKAIEEGGPGKSDEIHAEAENNQAAVLERHALDAAKIRALRVARSPWRGRVTSKRPGTSLPLLLNCRQGVMTNAGTILMQRPTLFTSKAMNFATR